MFHVPRHSGGHPRLAIAVLAVLCILAAGLAAWATVRPVPEAPAPEPLPPRPAVVVVQDLPQLTEQLERWGGSGAFTGGVLVAKGDQILFRGSILARFHFDQARVQKFEQSGGNHVVGVPLSLFFLRRASRNQNPPRLRPTIKAVVNPPSRMMFIATGE